ncbi:MAG: VWA domain-containing protein, partial [Pyrinomonadaceae bacterium]|nr:VWA domain-containing protein [Pyrinomonadaceae bacterium]
EEIGDFDSQQAQTLAINGVKPHLWGRGTKLLPPVKYFVDDKFKDAKWGIAIFVTDGIIEDLDDVKQFCLQFGQQISSGQRHFIKLVLIGVGEEVDEGQMEELDDMFEGSGLKDPEGDDIDLWDHKLASEMKKIEEIFAEVVSEHTIVAASGRALNSSGQVVKDYADGVPALLRFVLPAGSTSFKLEFSGGSVTQDISEGLARP